MLDIIQEGNLGLMKMVGRFDYRWGLRFCPLAGWGIRRAIVRAVVNQGRLVRLPSYLHTQGARLFSAQHRLTQDLARDPSTDELAEELKLPVNRVCAQVRFLQEPISIHSPAGEADDRSLAESMADETIALPGEVDDLKLIRDGLVGALASLTPHERKVITRRFGLDEEDASTLQEICDQLGVTRERVRQIESAALRKLRHPSRRQQLQFDCESLRLNN